MAASGRRHDEGRVAERLAGNASPRIAETPSPGMSNSIGLQNLVAWRT